MDFYTPRNEYDQITFSDFITTSHTPLPFNIQVMCIFSFYKNYNFDVSVLYQNKSFYIRNFNTSILPSKDVDIALLLPYSCPTSNLPYISEDIFDQIEDLQIYQNFWKMHTLTTYHHTKDYTYDPKYALGVGEKWSVYGNFEVFEHFFKNLLIQYKNVIVAKSFWTLHGFFDISKKFRNHLFKKKFPTLNWIMEKRTICFNHISKKQRIQKAIQFFEKKYTTSQHKINKSFDTIPCSFASIHISGIIHWMQDFETLQEYLCTGGQIKWSTCNEDPSIVTICPHSFLDLLENKEKLRVLINT